jgi:hypothetical protein
VNLETQFKIKTSPLLDKYIKENSYWYKYLNRNPKNIDYMIIKMKEDYKLTSKDKLERFNDKLDLISTFIDVMK